MANPDLPKFVPDPTGETVGSIEFGRMKPGVRYVVHDQTPRHREVARTTRGKLLVAITFLRDESISGSEGPTADLRDLALGRSSQSKLVTLLEASGIHPIVPEPSHTPEEPPVNQAEALQTASPVVGEPQVKKRVKSPVNHHEALLKKGFQPRRPQMVPSHPRGR